MNIEVWKSLDFMGYPDYEVSNFGRVKSLNYKGSGKEGILKQSKIRSGYLKVTLCKNKKHKDFTAHRIVALAFIPNPENLPCVNHKDENKENNHVDNLEFCTHEYNLKYGTRLEKISEKRKGFRFTEEAIQKMSNSHKGKKQSLEVINKIKEKNSKAVLQYTKEGVFIREWVSTITASKQLKIHHISECCNGKRKTCGGFVWRYK